MPTGSNRFTAIVLAGSAIYLYVNVFTFGGVPFLLGGDQVYFWTYGLRMLHGERIYHDFFTMHPPGTGLFYSTLFALFGERVWVTNLAVLLLGVLLCWVCFRIACQIMEEHLALLATWLFLVLVYGKMLNGTHHWFSVLAVMGAVAPPCQHP
jgi:Dolichyl-phosphate-mannose-protein mannosyltransferase